MQVLQTPGFLRLLTTRPCRRTWHAPASTAPPLVFGRLLIGMTTAPAALAAEQVLLIDETSLANGLLQALQYATKRYATRG
jgi:hypothetical protein